MTNQPIKYVIYSHHHFDHIAGGKALKDAGATFVAHKRAKERLDASARRKTSRSSSRPSRTPRPK